MVSGRLQHKWLPAHVGSQACLHWPCMCQSLPRERKLHKWWRVQLWRGLQWSLLWSCTHAKPIFPKRQLPRFVQCALSKVLVIFYIAVAVYQLPAVFYQHIRQKCLLAMYLVRHIISEYYLVSLTTLLRLLFSSPKPQEIGFGWSQKSLRCFVNLLIFEYWSVFHPYDVMFSHDWLIIWHDAWPITARCQVQRLMAVSGCKQVVQSWMTFVAVKFLVVLFTLICLGNASLPLVTSTCGLSCMYVLADRKPYRMSSIFNFDRIDGSGCNVWNTYLFGTDSKYRHIIENGHNSLILQFWMLVET